MIACKKCRDIGLVPVPLVTIDPKTGEITHHHHHVLVQERTGPKEWSTAWVPSDPPKPVMTTVVCLCRAGDRWRDSLIKDLQGVERRRMTLKDYEQELCPNWENDLAEFRRLTRETAWAEAKSTSPFRDLPVTDEHTESGQCAVAWTLCRANGLSMVAILDLVRQHPAYRYTGTLTIGIAHDLIRHHQEKTNTRKTA